MHYKKSIKGVASPIMLLGSGVIATFDGWPYELDRIFIMTGDEIKFDRFIAGIQVKQDGWRSKIIEYLKSSGEFLIIILIMFLMMFWLDQ